MDNEKKWIFGGRMTSNNPEESMKNNEWMLNNCYAESGKAMYRDHDGKYDIRHLITEIGETLGIHINATSPEALDFMLYDWLEYDIESRQGILAMLYNLLWSKAELYEHLKQYEDAEERGEIGRVPRWIPVTERLPENTADVLVFRPKMKIEIGISCRINDEWLRYGKDLHGNNVITHWMPLPEPPEVE